MTDSLLKRYWLLWLGLVMAIVCIAMAAMPLLLVIYNFLQSIYPPILWLIIGVPVSLFIAILGFFVGSRARKRVAQQEKSL